MKIDTVVMLYPFTPFSLDRTMKPQPLHCVLSQVLVCCVEPVGRWIDFGMPY